MAKTFWVDELPGTLWAYRTTPRSSTGETPFSLVYGSEAVIPVEIGEVSHRVGQYDPQGNEVGRGLELETIEEGRERAYIQMQAAKNRMKSAYDKNLKQRSFQVGDLVLKKVEVSRHVGKLDPNWEVHLKLSKF